MQTTMDLLNKAIETLSNGDKKKSQRELSVELGFCANAIGVAKNRKRLSPVAAGVLAEKLGEDPIYWAAIAGIETEKKSDAKNALIERAKEWKKTSAKALGAVILTCIILGGYSGETQASMRVGGELASGDHVMHIVNRLRALIRMTSKHLFGSLLKMWRA